MSRYEREKETMKRYAQSVEGKERHDRAKKKYVQSFRGRMKKRLYKKNLTEGEQKRAIAAFKNFDGKCMCCAFPEHNGKGWHLDHKGQKFRGILCHLCNGAAAFLRDNVGIALKMVSYLRKHQ